MKKCYRAYDQETDRWHYFELIATDEGWELKYPYYKLGDKSNTSEQENFNVAYLNLTKIVEQLNLTKLTEDNILA